MTSLITDSISVYYQDSEKQLWVEIFILKLFMLQIQNLINKNEHGRDRPYKKIFFFFFWYLNRRENLESRLPFLLFWLQTYMPVLCHYTDLVISVVMRLFLSHPDFAIHVFSFLLSPMLWSLPLECVSYSGTAYISFDRNTALANLPFF